MDIVLMVIGAVWLLGGVPLYLLVAHRERQQTKRSADIAVRDFIDAHSGSLKKGAAKPKVRPMGF